MYEIRSYLVVTRDATMVGGKLTFLGFEGAILAENAFPRIQCNWLRQTVKVLHLKAIFLQNISCFSYFILPIQL